MCQDLWNRKSSQTLIICLMHTCEKEHVCEWKRWRDKRLCTRGYCCFHTEYWFGPSGGGLFWVVVLNMTTHRYLYLYPLNFSFLLLLLFCYPTEMQQLATEAFCAHPLIGMLHPVRGSRGQTHIPRIARPELKSRDMVEDQTSEVKRQRKGIDQGEWASLSKASQNEPWPGCQGKGLWEREGGREAEEDKSRGKRSDPPCRV